ncbi:hypothetical protein JOB18_044369 [Solea senegalensis]|uniref:Oxidative stress-responsive serine-rich protein 1 n=1 Tax=Solea senegalensis TaxID=28829 RepID=A0AAV6QPM0_SOLSE|nr:oxidative stress-responsive serine-rich protein 1 [Solea senegalensis]KAG7495098.1 hypothetical protein JOB18_044369 [Solea senegalensis]
MEAGGKDCEEETLQTAFKKLRVDAESLPGAVSVSEALAPRAAPRPGSDTSGTKTKLSSPKDNWHGCTRKSSRGAARTQRRRRSKSPILHPPKFTYCSTSTASALSPSGGCLKHQRLATPEPAEPRPPLDTRSASAKKELPTSGNAGHVSPLVFGSCAGFETLVGAAVSSPSLENPGVAPVVGAGVQSGKEGDLEKSACGGAASGSPRRAEAADFRALSELHCSVGGASVPCCCCCCTQKSSPDSQERIQGSDHQCQCQSHPQGWHGVEVYAFTGLRDVISECEQSLPSHGGSAPRTPNSNPAASTTSSPLPSGSPRSCSEQARGYVDDITIEDLSGYMEYYLYIPKKMSHMAEMMYT